MTARILVVDDDAAIAEMIGIVLRGEGFEPHFSFDGIAAIEAFASVEPDLVLLDLMLPGIDGIQVCTRIRETSGTPIIMLARGNAAITEAASNRSNQIISVPARNEVFNAT